MNIINEYSKYAETLGTIIKIPKDRPNPIYNPTNSRRIKNKILRKRKNK